MASANGQLGVGEQLHLIREAQNKHDKEDNEMFARLWNEITNLKVAQARMVVVVAILNAIGGSVLTMVGMIIIKKFGI